MNLLTRLLSAFRERVLQLEEITVGPAGWTAGFLATVAVRHLLELRSGQFPMYPPSAFYIHYVLAYLAPLLLLSMILAVFSSVPLERVLRLMLLAWGLTLLPPLLDTLVTAPHEAKIGYMEIGETPFSTVFIHFFDPTYPLKGTTPGIRIEALLACILGFTYVVLRAPRRRLARGIATVFGVYVASLFVFTLPFLFARALRLIYPGLSPSVLYNAAGKVPRPASLDVRTDQAILLYLVPLTLLLGAAALALARPTLLRRLLSGIFGSEGWAWGILAVLGTYAGWRILHGVPKDTPSVPFDALAFAAGPLSLVLAGGALARLAPDRSERLWRSSLVGRFSSVETAEPSLEPLARSGLGAASLERGAAMLLLMAALLLAAVASRDFAAFVAIAVGAGVLARGIPRVLPWAVLAPQLAAGIGALAAFLAGYSLLAGDESVTLLPSALYLLVFLAGLVADLPRAFVASANDGAERLLYEDDVRARSGDGPRALARLAAAAPAAVPLIALLVPTLETRAPISTGVIVVAVLFSFATLAASQMLPVRLATGTALLGAGVVLGVCLSEPGQAASWRARALASPTYFLRLADRLESAGSLDAAAGALDEALRRDPSLAAAHQRLGLVRFKRGDYAGAIAALKEAVAHDPRDADLQGNLATALMKANQPDEALTIVERALSIDPVHPKLLFIRAQALDAVGKLGEANRAWELYIARARDIPEEAEFVASARRRLAGLPP